MDRSLLVPDMVRICEQAGGAIMEVYQHSDFGVETKQDNSPVTAADLAAHRLIEAGLNRLNPTIPQLSEEASDCTDFAQRRHWPLYWCIDPLDGTKEFIHRNGEFTVNIALVEHGKPVLGMIHLPAQGITYWGGDRVGAWKKESNGTVHRIHTRPLGRELIVAASRRHGQERNDALLEKLSAHFDQVSCIASGSSLKMCLIAEGGADLYPRLFATAEWDTAAAQAIVEAAGGILVDATSLKPLRYNQRESLENPHFFVAGDPGFPLQALL